MTLQHFLTAHYYEFVSMAAGVGIGIVATVITQTLYRLVVGTASAITTATTATVNLFTPKDSAAAPVTRREPHLATADTALVDMFKARRRTA